MPNKIYELLPIMDFLLSDAKNHCLHQPEHKSFVTDRLAQVLDCRVGNSDCEFDKTFLPGSRKMPENRSLVDGRRNEFGELYFDYYCSDLSYHNQAGEFVWDIWDFYYSFEYLMSYWNDSYGSFPKDTETRIKKILSLPPSEMKEKVEQELEDIGYDLEEVFGEEYDEVYYRDMVEGALYLFFRLMVMPEAENFVFSSQKSILPGKRYYDDIYLYLKKAINDWIFQQDGGDPLLEEKCAGELMPYFFRSFLSASNSECGYSHLHLGHSEEVDEVLYLAKTGTESGYPYFHQMVELAKKCLLLPEIIDFSGEGVLYRRRDGDGEVCVIHFGNVYATAVIDDLDFFDELGEGFESVSFLSLSWKVFSRLYEDFQSYMSHREGVLESDIESCTQAG